MFVSKDNAALLATLSLSSQRNDPRAEMAERLPAFLQPFLTWLTAKPAPGDVPREKLPVYYVIEACALVVLGCVASVAALTLLTHYAFLFWPLLICGLTATTSGLGLFQVTVFHHCSHGTVFKGRAQNRAIGRLVSAILLFKHFDHYQKEHMLHHNANKLFTDDDEFTDFVVGICDLETSLERKVLWRRLTCLLVSPVFHGRFMIKRIQGALGSHERSHNMIGLAAWGSLIILGLATHSLSIIATVWFLPVTVLLQIATVFRILCEHRLPSVDVIEQRGQNLICEATAGVFPGSMPPSASLPVLRRMSSWALWWTDMLTVQLFVRVFVLVGDAPCHDFHHRRPGKKWTNYIHARQADVNAGCPGFPKNYVDTWGLFRAIDQNFAAMARAPRNLLG